MADYAMDEVHPGTALDRGVQGVLGVGIDRIDGPAKVAGAATYALDNHPDGYAHGYPIIAAAGAGRVVGIDADAARTMPGVFEVIVGDAALPRQTPVWGEVAAQPYDGTLRSYGELVGVAVAASFEEARAAAQAVRVETAPDAPATDITAVAAESPPADAMLPDVVKGDLDAAMAAAVVAIDATYSTPRHVHAAMEPHGSVVTWDDTGIDFRASVQLLRASTPVMAKSLDVAPEAIHTRSPFIGGGFGGKNLSADALAAAVASRRTGRPVKVALPRRQIFHLCYGRSDTHQRLRLAADRDGRLLGMGQDSLVAQKQDCPGFEPVALGAVSLYAAPARHFTTRIAHLNLTAHGPVRAPGEAVGMMGLECAMDELAEALALDPVELRRRNEPANDPTHGKPFTSRRLLDCFDEGVRRFGWARHAPGSRRDGEWLIGTGMATAARVNFLADSSARVRIDGAGRVTVETDMTDIGTGTYTILAQVAAESLGVPVDAVTVRLGESGQPVGAGSGGSFGAASSASSVALACDELVRELARRLDVAAEDVTLRDGFVTADNRRRPLGEVVGADGVAATGTIRPGANNRRFSQATHGAQFAEVRVNAVTGEVRVTRMLGVFDCGRILNAKTARSQAIGGMIWGLGYALHEEAHVDPRNGRYANGDLGEYLIPTNADVPQIEAYFVEEIDRKANPVGAKGIGELGISGSGAAVANAVYNACGVRVRDFPLTCDKLLAGLPAL